MTVERHALATVARPLGSLGGVLAASRSAVRAIYYPVIRDLAARYGVRELIRCAANFAKTGAARQITTRGN
jgi:hypothetical protein